MATSAGMAAAESYKFAVRLTLEEFDAASFNGVDVGCQLFSDLDQTGSLLNVGIVSFSNIAANASEQLIVEVSAEQPAKSWTCRTFGKSATDDATSHFGTERPTPWRVRSGSVVLAKGNFEQSAAEAPAFLPSSDSGATLPDTPPANSGPDTEFITRDSITPFRP